MNLVFVDKLLGSRALIVRAHSPEILLGVGIAGVVGSTVLACRATLKCTDVIENAKNDLEKVHICVNAASAPIDGAVVEYNEMDRRKDLTLIYTNTAISFAKLYGPSVILGGASVACIIGGHNILRKRNVAVMAAYKVLDEGFKAYRQRVISEYGEDQDYMFRHGLHADIVTEEVTDDNGKVRKIKKTELRHDPDHPSIYARFFDECSTEWSPTPEYNRMFLKTQQQYFNDKLRARGHVFLNEVYDALGLPRSSAGAVVGWIGKGDNYIDFGIFDGDTQEKREFLNGYERSILLDFNVDGVIYNLL